MERNGIGFLQLASYNTLIFIVYFQHFILIVVLPMIILYPVLLREIENIIIL